jgi:glutathione S-transferase
MASTYSKKVRLALYEKNIPFESHLLDLQKFEQHAPDYLVLNPNGVVPTLVDGGKTGDRKLDHHRIYRGRLSTDAVATA